MKYYESPEVTVIELNPADEVTSSFIESGEDNNAEWLNQWASALGQL